MVGFEGLSLWNSLLKPSASLHVELMLEREGLDAAMPSRRLFLAASALASFLIPFTSMAVNVALPAVARALDVDMASANWFANVFLMSMASAVLLFGVVADWLGRELMFITGTAIFTAAAFSVLYTSEFAWLLALRCVQGLGAAMISGTAIAILASLFPEKTGVVIGVNTTAVYVGVTLGPFLGGLLVDYAGWPSLFLLSGAIAAVSFTLASSSLSFSKRGGGRRPHLQTLLLFTLSTILVSTGSAYPRSTHGLAALSLGLAAFTSALYKEYRKPLNLVEQVFEGGTFLAYMAALLNYVATYAITILYSNFLQVEAGFTAGLAGTILLAQPIPQALLSPLAGYLADRSDPGLLAAAGMSFIALGIGTSLAGYRWLSLLVASLIILGVGFAFFASPNTTQIMRRIPKEALASASSFLGLMRFLGQSLSTSILTATMLTLKTPVPMEASLTVYLIVAVAAAAVAAMSAQRGRSRQPSSARRS